MKIAFNPSTVAALIAPPNNKDITFDLRGQNIFARGVKFCGTDTNTWRDIKINNVSIDSNTLDLRDSSTTTLTNINGVVTINSTWRPVVDNLTSDSTTSSLSANQGRVLKALIDGKSDSDHNHDDRYLRLTGGWMSGDINFGGDNRICWGRNTDSASISFKNDGDGDADSYMSFVTSDNGNEYFRWSHSSGSTNTEWMSLRSDGLRVGGTKVSLEGHSHNDLYYTKTEVNNKLNSKSDTDHTHDDRYLKLTGGTMLGALNFANGTWNLVGDDVYMGDHNIGGLLCIMGANGTTGLSFHKYGDASIRKSITFDGNTLYMNGSCDYATLSNLTNLLAINTVPNKTTSTSIGSWSPISGRYVFHQKWTDTSTGSDSADFGIYLDGNLTANMVLDGYYNSLLGFRVIGATGGFLKANGTIDNSTYLTSHLSLSNYYTKSEVDTKLNSKLNYRLFWERTNIDLNNITEAWHTYEVNNGTGTANTPTNASWHQAVLWGTGDTDYAVLLCTAYTSNYSLYLRHKIAGKWYNWIQLAATTDIPSSLKNPYALTISLNGTSQGPYDGSAAKNINITPGSIGAATSDHNHINYLSANGNISGNIDNIWTHGTYGFVNRSNYTGTLPGNSSYGGFLVLNPLATTTRTYYTTQIALLPGYFGYRIYDDGKWYNWKEVSMVGHNHDGRYVRYYAVTTLDCNNLAVGLTAAGVSATNAAHTNHSAFLYISDVGTPFQIQIPDSSVPYIYKRYYSSGTWSGWFKLNAGYADSAGNADTIDGLHYSSFLRKDTNDSTPYQYTFTKTDGHAIKVGTVRGTAVGSQTGDYIHLYERVAIGSPNGWGSRPAPSYGLATYGGAWLATDTGSVGIGTTNPSSKLTVNGVGDDKLPVQLINASRDSTWVYNASFLAPNLTSNHNNAIFIGKAHSTCNAFGLTHMHIKDGSASNYAALEVWGVGNVLRWYYDRHSSFLHRADFSSLGSDASYMNSALLIREHGYNGVQADTWANAPRMSWHWSGRVQTQIGLGSNNELYLSKNNFGNAYRLMYETGTWGINITGNAASATNADTVDGVHANQLCRIYTFNVHNSIIKVGTLTSGQYGHVCKLRFNSGIGYNAGNQDKTMTVVIRASNGGANSNGFYFEAHSESYRGGAFTTFYLHQTSKTQCELYMAAFNYSGQSTYEISFSNGDSWTNEISGQDALPTSNIFTLPNYQIAYTDYNVASATKLQTPRTIWGQSFDGTADIDNTLRIRQTTNNWCEGIRIQNGDNTWATIILGATSDYGTNTNAWSIHRKDDNNFSISRNSSDGLNGLVMTSTGMGLGTTAPYMRLHVNGDGIYLNSTATCGINMYSSHSESSISYKSIDGTRTVLGTYTNRTFLWNESIGEHVSILSSNGYFGIGTTNPYYKLDVNGDIWCRGALRVGSSTTNNYIAFYGNTGDAPGSFVTSFIGEHLWGGNESSELLLMKFNDVGNGTDGTTVSGPGPDRIRHIAHAHVFLIMTDTSLGDFATMAATTAVETKLDITRNRITASVPLYLQSDLHVNGNIYSSRQIIREGQSTIWAYGRGVALLRETSAPGYHTLWSLKTTNGSWDFGEYNTSGWYNVPVLSYITDSNYNSGNNVTTYQIKFPLASGTVALTSYGGDNSHPIFLGYLNLDHGNDGTVSSSFYCLGYSVPFTYTRGGNYCRINIPDTTHQVFYIRAATASVHYSGGGMDTWVGEHRADGAWWLHCYASSTNEVRVKGFHLRNDHNDSWWGGNPLWSSNGGANRITVCIFGYVTFR